MHNLVASYSNIFFLLYKLYNYFPTSDILSNDENNTFNQHIQRLFAVLVPGVVVQLQVSLSTDQDLVAFQVHPADLPRRFQQSLKLDNYYQAQHSSKSPLGTSSPWGQGLVEFMMCRPNQQAREMLQTVYYVISCSVFGCCCCCGSHVILNIILTLTDSIIWYHQMNYFLFTLLSILDTSLN